MHGLLAGRQAATLALVAGNQAHVLAQSVHARTFLPPTLLKKFPMRASAWHWPELLPSRFSRRLPLPAGPCQIYEGLVECCLNE